MDYPVTYRRTVRYSDSDAQGIVFNANYLAYVDDAIYDYMRALLGNWDSMTGRGYDIVLGRAEIDFRSSGRIGETLATGVRIASCGTTSIVFDLAIWEEASGRSVVEGREIQVMVDAATFEKMPVPEWFVQAVESFQGAPVEWRARP
jgi:YbgC/YbaW family acyl-CoA thioester hydrolase